jgi:hypothetical protein
MSIAVVVIAAIHAVPVVGAAIFMGRGGAVVAAVVMSVIAVTTGGPQYVGIDLAAIGIALIFCLKG